MGDTRWRRHRNLRSRPLTGRRRISSRDRRPEASALRRNVGLAALGAVVRRRHPPWGAAVRHGHLPGDQPSAGASAPSRSGRPTASRLICSPSHRRQPLSGRDRSGGPEHPRRHLTAAAPHPAAIPTIRPPSHRRQLLSRRETGAEARTPRCRLTEATPRPTASPAIRSPSHRRQPPSGRENRDGSPEHPRAPPHRSAPHPDASRMICSRSRPQQRLISRETCIWEMPSCSAIRLWVMSPKKRM
ncbi:hypothetical protein M2161_007429 [Streptomyces sp. SAI-133]|nr:hypothetical protein [Streptomyces sp. SAI-133]